MIPIFLALGSNLGGFYYILINDYFSTSKQKNQLNFNNPWGSSVKILFGKSAPSNKNKEKVFETMNTTERKLKKEETE